MTVTITPTVEPSTGAGDPPRIRLDIIDTDGLSSVNVTRLGPDGRTVPVRTADGNAQPLTSGTALLYDYEAPFGEAVSYSTLEDPSTSSAQVAIDSDSVWLIHVGVPVLSMPIDLRAGSLQEEEWAVQQGVFWPMGRETPVVQTDGARKAASSSVTVAIETPADLRSLKTLLGDASTLLLNIPVAMGLGVDTCYIAAGNVRNARPSDIGSDPHRDVVIPFQIVGRPAGGAQAEWTYTDILVGYPTYSALQAAFPTAPALLAGP